MNCSRCNQDLGRVRHAFPLQGITWCNDCYFLEVARQKKEREISQGKRNGDDNIHLKGKRSENRISRITPL